MSIPSASPSDSAPLAKTELETVVNRPLLVIAGGFGLLLVIVPFVLAGIASLQGGAVKVSPTPRATLPDVRPMNPTVVAEIPRNPAEDAIPTAPADAETARPRQAGKPVVRWVTSAKPAPRPLDPVLQFPDGKTPPAPKRLDGLSEDVLRANLAKQAKEVDLESVKGTREKLLAKARKSGGTALGKKGRSAILALCAERDDLKGLPLIGEDVCQVKAETAKKMQLISREMRLRLRIGGSLTSTSHYSTSDLAGVLSKRGDWLQDDGLPTVAQMVQIEVPPIRRQFVESLALVKNSRATAFLARLALFDLSRDVRERAVQSLKDRPRKDCRQMLLDGLRYPWPPVAAHAAEALVALDDQEAIAPLDSLLDEPDPCAPRCDKNNGWVVAEMVRINHLRNCLLCHAPSIEKTDLVRGIVPTPGQRLPRGVYYESQKGDFVRADVTYLRQDFSLMERVEKPNNWPQWQRFDYLVRTRELTADERAAFVKTARKKPTSYPQRQAVLFALRELTGLDVGDESDSWHELIRWLDDPS